MKIGYQLKQVRERLAKGLVDKGVLRTEKRNFLLFDMATHPVSDPTFKDDVLRRTLSLLTSRTAAVPTSNLYGDEVRYRTIRAVAMICSAFAANVLENALVHLGYDQRESAFAKADELLADFSQWPFGAYSQPSSSSNGLSPSMSGTALSSSSSSGGGGAIGTTATGGGASRGARIGTGSSAALAESANLAEIMRLARLEVAGQGPGDEPGNAERQTQRELCLEVVAACIEVFRRSQFPPLSFLCSFSSPVESSRQLASTLIQISFALVYSGQPALMGASVLVDRPNLTDRFARPHASYTHVSAVPPPPSFCFPTTFFPPPSFSQSVVRHHSFTVVLCLLSRPLNSLSSILGRGSAFQISFLCVCQKSYILVLALSARFFCRSYVRVPRVRPCTSREVWIWLQALNSSRPVQAILFICNLRTFLCARARGGRGHLHAASQASATRWNHELRGRIAVMPRSVFSPSTFRRLSGNSQSALPASCVSRLL